MKLVLLLRKDGAAVQFPDNRHAADDVLERYSMGRLAGPELAEFEKHLLVCECCQDRLAREDSFIQGVRLAGAVLQQPRAALRPRLPKLPKLAWAFGLAGAVLAVVGGIEWRTLRHSADPPAMILLRTTRGPETPTLAAPAGKPLTVTLDLTGLPQLPAYKLEIVDAGGRPAFQSTEALRNNQLQATLASGLAAGAYFVRLYNPAGELLREYALNVRA